LAGIFPGEMQFDELGEGGTHRHFAPARDRIGSIRQGSVPLRMRLLGLGLISSQAAQHTHKMSYETPNFWLMFLLFINYGIGVYATRLGRAITASWFVFCAIANYLLLIIAEDPSIVGSTMMMMALGVGFFILGKRTQLFR
jgi:hypothetical protein